MATGQNSFFTSAFSQRKSAEAPAPTPTPTLNAMGRLSFDAAAELWLESRKAYLRKRTFIGYKLHIQQLSRFFGPQRLHAIHVGHLRAYQKARTENEGAQWAKECGPSIINHELVTMQAILARAGEWDKIKRHFEPLPLPSSRPPKVMTDAEEMLLLDIASKNPDWAVAYWVASITLNTGAAGAELRNLRYEDVHLDAPKPWFRVDDATAKNEYRGRAVPLNSTAKQQMERCVQRGNELGSGRPEHYVFPFRINRALWDPTRPTTDAWLRRSFKEMATAAGLPWLTPHCLRHQHITLSVEAGEPIEQIALRVGHVSPNMTRWYLNARPATQCAAVDRLDPSVRFASNEQKPSKSESRVISFPARASA